MSSGEERARFTERKHVDFLRGATKLAVEATKGVTELVEEVHRTIATGPAILGKPLEMPARILTSAIYGTVRGVTHRVGTGMDVGLARLAPWFDARPFGPRRDALLAALNGVLGDYLSESNNPLAIQMEFCLDGRPLRFPQEALDGRLPRVTRKLLVLVHGSSMSDRQWTRLGHDHGAALARDLGYLPIYLRYNSGLHISSNGWTLARQLEQLSSTWRTQLEEVTIVGHSMGGLVARSACYAAEVEGHRWRPRLRKLVCLGSPHHGAPLERYGSWIDLLLGLSPYSAPFVRLGRIRSAGVTDMRFGNVLDEHWAGRDRFAWANDDRRPLSLPAGVDCYTIAATTAATTAAKLPSDGLVPVDSALGRHTRAELTLTYPETHQWIGFGMGHLDLLSHPEVYKTLRAWLS